MKYFIYARKSKGSEDRYMLPVEAQLGELHRYAERENLNAVREYVEAETAKKPGRPVFNDMLSRIQCHEADGILSLHPDRLTRNSTDTQRITYLMMQDAIKELRFIHQGIYRSELLRSFWPGSEEAWRLSREVILEGVHKDGTFLDVGCANGVLLRDLCMWAKKKSINLIPFGFDINRKLIEESRKKIPPYRKNFMVANEDNYKTNKKFTFIRMPLGNGRGRQRLLKKYLGMLESGGRLVITCYDDAKDEFISLEKYLKKMTSKLDFVFVGSAVVPERTKVFWLERRA